MKIESIKSVNITGLFTTPLNHLLIDQKSLLDLLKTGNEEEDKHTFIEGPGFKALFFVNRQKEIIFEPNRILINDKSGKDTTESTVIDDLEKISKAGLLNPEDIHAYGFNFDVALNTGEELSTKDILGEKLLSIENVKRVGVSVAFVKNEIKYDFQLKPIADGLNKFLAHLNAHFVSKGLPDSKVLKKSFKEQYKEIEVLIGQI